MLGKSDDFSKLQFQVTDANIDTLENPFDYIHFNGYWHNPKYLKPVEKEIRNKFQFNVNNLSQKNTKILEKIKASNSVSIHVRRNDYLKINRYINLGETSFYTDAIALLKKHYSNLEYYIFSDDITWCKNYFKNLDNTHFIDWNTDENSYWDMFLMSQCKHNIIANSSFSRWGAYLNSNPHKITLQPSRWTTHQDTTVPILDSPILDSPKETL